jgi:hypothetical protein
MRTGELIRASLPALKEALRSGQQPEATPTYEAMQDQITATRRALHEIRQEEIIKAAPIIRAGCERLYAGLQKMVREQEAGERDGIFARWKTEFRPSNALQGLIYFALCAMRPALDCEEGGAMVTPTSDPRRLWGFVIQNQPAPPLPEGTTLGEARDLARNRIDKERQKQLDREASERDQAEHRRRIAQINLVNDSIRHQSPTAEPPILPGYIARAATPRPTAEPPATQPPTPEPPPGEIPATKP